MRAIADDRLDVSRAFGEELYFCLGCLACQSACPAGVDFAHLFEQARAEVERRGVLDAPLRAFVRRLILRWLFTSRRRLHAVGALLLLYQRSGLQGLVRRPGLLSVFPRRLRELESLTPRVRPPFTEERFKRHYLGRNPKSPRYRVGLLIGCVQDIAFAHVNEDTIRVLQENGCEVVVPEAQACCGSLHAHNGDLETARDLAKRNIDALQAEDLDAVISNAGGCGSHMKHYGRLLGLDPDYAERARIWAGKVRDIHEFLVEIGFRKPETGGGPRAIAYHESCHLVHGQKVSDAPRAVIASLPSCRLVELPEADWCCGSAGSYSITQPAMAQRLLDRKMENIKATGCDVVAAANPGCILQIKHGCQRAGLPARVAHPVSLLAEAYRADTSPIDDGKSA
jgi:glycolate oxidase iron-sulfur subunit